jgi:hypothetical protein
VRDAETGQPIAGVTGPFGSITGADGSYSYDKVPLGENNGAIEWPLRASKDPPAFAHIGSYWDALGTGVYVCGQTTVVDFPLVPVHPGYVSGTVFVGNPDPFDYGKVIPTSTPIEGARPTVPYLAPEQPFTTGADGHYDLSFHLDVNNGPIGTAVLVDVPGLPYRHGYWQNSVGFHVSADEHVHLDIGLVKQCTASISGQAIHADAGLPAANVNIGAGNAAITDIVPVPGEDPPVATDAQGRFSIPEILIGHNNQPVKLGVDATGSAGYLDAHDESPDAIGCGGHWDARLVLQPGPALHVGALQGHVYDTETGAPIADATVCVDFCSGVATTDSQGFYRIDGIGVSFDSSITTRQAPVAAIHNQAPIYYGDSGTVDIVVGATAVHDFHLLRQRCGRVTGVVRDEITHASIAGAAVSCSGGGGVADQNGGYDTGQTLPPDYPNAATSTSCRFLADGYWYRDVSTTIRAGETTQLDVDLLPVCHATISGTVVDAVTLRPIQGASVAGGGVSATTGADGGYRLDNVTVGYNNSPLDVGVTAAAPGYFTQTKTVTVFCGGTIVLDFGRVSTGRIRVVKRTSPAGSAQRFDFTRNWGAAFSLGDGETFDSGPIAAGSGYSVGEAQPLPDGWTQTSASCSDGSPVADINVSAGETVTCTFTNQQGGQSTGTVVVSKSCPNGTARDGDRFQVTANGQPVGDPLACGGLLNVSVAAGSGYAIDEQAAGTANLGSYTKQLSAGCTGTLASGGSARCTITNTLKAGTIVVRKQTQPAGSATKFAFAGDAAGAIGDGQSITVSNLAPGNYSLAETVPAGWNLGSTCHCDRDVPLDTGETVTCTFITTGAAEQLRHLRLHQPLHDPTQRLAQEIEPLTLEQVANDPLAPHPLGLGHRGDSSRRRLGGPDEFERRGGRTLYPAPSDALPHHLMGRDPHQTSISVVGGTVIACSDWSEHLRAPSRKVAP